MRGQQDRIALLLLRLAEGAKQEVHLASERESLFRELATEYHPSPEETRSKGPPRQPHTPDLNRPVSDIAQARAKQSLARLGITPRK